MHVLELSAFRKSGRFTMDTYMSMFPFGTKIKNSSRLKFRGIRDHPFSSTYPELHINHAIKTKYFVTSKFFSHLKILLSVRLGESKAEFVPFRSHSHCEIFVQSSCKLLSQAVTLFTL